MRTTLLTALLLPALLLTVPAHAARWVGIGNKASATAARYEIDAESITTASDGKLRIWHRETYAQPKIPDSGAFSFTRLTSLTEFQCDKRLAATLARRYTAADGSELMSETFNTRETVPVTPDSTLETVFNYACKPRSKPAAKPPEPAPPPAPVVEVKEVPKKKLKKGQVEPPPPPPHWTYSGNTGAEKWGSLGKEFATCSLGQRQSPIDIRRTIRADLPAIEFAYQPVALAIVDNGHSIKVDAPDAGTITVDDHRRRRELRAAAVPLPPPQRGKDQRQGLRHGRPPGASVKSRKARGGRRALRSRQGARSDPHAVDPHAAGAEQAGHPP